MSSLEQNEVIYHILEYLNSIKTESNADNLDTISSLLTAEFNVDLDSENFKKYSVFPQGLDEVIAAGKESLKAKEYSVALAEAKANPKFDSFVEAVVSRGYFDGTTEDSVEYLQRYAKLVHKFSQKTQGEAATASADAAAPSSSSAATAAEKEKEAEELKFKGNAAINAKDFEKAIEFYTQALELSSEGPQSHVYYSNRAAAYCHQTKYKEAVDDCLSSVALCPDYVKAYSRLGLCYFFLEKFEDSVEAYERAAELEPESKSHQDSLRQARNKLKKVKAKDGEAAGVGPALGGLGGLMGNPAMKKALDQVGGASGLSNLMKDPQMMAMAQQMMKDPAMMQQAMSMLGGGGGGGMPDLSALAGMMGGAPSSSSSAPSSSSAKKGGFKGFEE